MLDPTILPVPLVLDGKGKVASNTANVATILGHLPGCVGVLAFDAFRLRRVKRKVPPWGGTVGDLADEDYARIRAWLQSTCGINASTEAVTQAVLIVCSDSTFDPLVEEVTAFRWDGVQRAETFFPRYFGARDDAYTRAVSRMFLVSMAARALRAGCKVDTMPILEGAQGLRKSSGLRAFAGAHNFDDTEVDFGSKDAMQCLVGCWLKEIAELAAMWRSQQNTMKAFLSKSEDRFRPSYGRETVTNPRRTVFAGSTNDTGYLQDPTGARRFWPVVCTRVDTDAIDRDRGVLIAEAVARFVRGEHWWYDETDAVAELARSEQASRHQEHAWLEPLSAWLSARPARLRDQGVTTFEALTEAIGMDKDKIRHSETMLIGRLLIQLGWRRSSHQIRRGDLRTRPYLPPDTEPALSSYVTGEAE